MTCMTTLVRLSDHQSVWPKHTGAFDHEQVYLGQQFLVGYAG